MLSLCLLPLKIWARTLTTRFTVRIHTNLVQQRWAKLWYLLRGLDWQGSSYIRVALADLCEFLGAKTSTVYEWLRLGSKDNAFRWWKCQRGILRVRYTSLVKLTLALGLDGWGYTATIPLHEILSMKALSTGIVAQRLQQSSRFAAWRSLPGTARRTYKLPQPDAFFGDANRLSVDSPLGSIRYVLHRSQRRVFTSKGFVPYGVNQTTIAKERSLSDRTVRRHITKIGLERKQLVQAKSDYKHITFAMQHEADFQAKGGTAISFPDLWKFGEGLLSERPGGIGQEYNSKVRSSRFFEWGGQTWKYLTNLYKPVYKLCTMRRRMREYREALERLIASSAPSRRKVAIDSSYITTREEVSEILQGFV